MNIFELNEDILKLDTKYIEMIETMKAEALSFCENFDDDPSIMSDWGHHYYCPKDGEMLTFDLTKPKDHVCGLCGTVYKSEQLDRTWTYLYRHDAILTLMKLSVLYRAYKEPRYLEEYKKLLLFYADNYMKFELHAKDVPHDGVNLKFSGAARIMSQELNEAMILVRIMVSLEILKEDLSKEFIDHLNDVFFVNIADVLIPQLDKIHNKPCWINAAVGCMGLFTGNKEWIDIVYNGEFSVNEQLRRGVTEDKFWYEGSVHYNFFLLEAIVYLLAFSRAYNHELEEEDVIRDMLIKGYHFTFENDVFPNPNDSWPSVGLRTYEYVYAVAAKIFGEGSEVYEIYKHILANPFDRVKIPMSEPYHYKKNMSFEHLVCLPGINFEDRNVPARKSTCYPNSFFAMLKNENINLFMKYGHKGPGHAHRDKMNIEVMIGDKMLTRDMANSGYSSTLCLEWYRLSPSHNTVMVDGQNHVSMDGGDVLKYNDTCCHAITKNVHDGVDYKRAVEIFDDGFTDVFDVISKDVHNYDWIFHCQADLLTELELEESDLGYKENGYQHIQDVKKLVNVPDELVLEWDLQGTKLTSTIKTAGKEVFLTKTYDNPASTFRTGVMLRAKTDSTTFDVNWKVIK
ncbi:MAG: heparinase II/III family protein [Clostridia bacterium]